MTETQLRFLRALVDLVPLSRIVEVHLFPPMRQGILESGIAIVAATVDTPETVDAPNEASASIADDAPYAQADDTPGEVSGEACDPTEDASRDAPGRDGARNDGKDAAERAAPGSRLPAPHSRLTVYTARYRLTIKGPERGKWEQHVVEEADAPLLTVEMVVRGVQRRSGEGADPERLDVGALRELLEVPAA